jgi:SAM-dependent methyltransferase
MTLKVLKTYPQVAEARRELVGRNLSFVDRSFPGKVRRFLNQRGISRSLVIGDELKSWDVLETVRFLEDRVPKDAAVLDIGCYASEVLLALDALGFSDLNGVDFDPRVVDMPHADRIGYRVADFMRTPFEAEHFGAVTAISVIEHGLDAPRLLAEVQRILKPNGFFVASFDYWPDKIATDHVRMFGMQWRIFARDEVESFVAEAAAYGLRPTGDLIFDADERAIRHAGFDYTFAWLALQKRR